MTFENTIVSALHWFAVAVTLAFGIWSFVQPKKSASTVFFNLESSRAIAEYRIGFGGMLTGICGWIIYAQEPAAFKSLGFIWLGAAVARALAWFIDNPKPSAFYVGALIFELIMAACLLS
jgi:Domain of unknown function (DUF4345)